MRFHSLGVGLIHVVGGVVLPAIEDARDQHLLPVDPEQDGRTPFKADNPDSGSDGIANGAAFRER